MELLDLKVIIQTKTHKGYEICLLQWIDTETVVPSKNQQRFAEVVIIKWSSV